MLVNTNGCKARLIIGGVAFWLPLQLQAQAEPHIESINEILVSTPFQATTAETALPIGVLSGEELQEKVVNNLGATLKNEIGINNASFGPSLGHPVIRGQSGNRVSVLQNSVGVTDASNQSPDHAEGVEPVLAERLEVIRGPSTLLYGSGAVGGVVNVIDNRIPETLPAETEIVIQQSHNTVNDGNKTVFRLDGSAGNLGFHLSGVTRSNNDVSISGLAIDEAGLEAQEELVAARLEHDEDHDEDHDGDPGEDHGDEHGEEHGDEHEELENTDGFISNSDAEADSAIAGLSYIGERGFIGFSVNRLESDYGLPAGSHSHSHEHGEEEHSEEHDHDEEEHGEEHGEVDFVRINMEKTRYDARAMWEFGDGWFETLRANVGYTDYEHAEVEYFEDGDQEVGTLYSNSGFEGRFTLDRAATGAWSGVYGLQFTDTDFSAIGEEAFIPPSAVNNVGIFGVERFSGARYSVELGFRLESNAVDPGGQCGYDDSTLSLSSSLLYDLSSESNVLLGLSRSERAPTVEELFSNVSLDGCGRFADDEDLVSHAATGLLEIGNPNLDKETASNLEIGFRKHSGDITAELSAYHNRINEYIFLDLGGEEVEGQPVAEYLTGDARFTGVEGKITFGLMETAAANLELSLFGDLVRARLEQGGNVPRIPPAKLGAELRLVGSQWSMHMHVTNAQEQNDVGDLELPTDGYTELSLYGDYHWALGESSELKVFVRGDNLLDEEIRNHASFLKYFAPEPGRGVTVGMRLDF